MKVLKLKESRSLRRNLKRQRKNASKPNEIGLRTHFDLSNFENLF